MRLLQKDTRPDPIWLWQWFEESTLFFPPSGASTTHVTVSHELPYVFVLPRPVESSAK